MSIARLLNSGRALAMLTVVCLLAVTLLAARAAEPEATTSQFSSSTIDIGVVCGDVSKSVAFYKAIGFQELPGFDVPAQITADVGLIDNHPLHVHVMTLGDGPTATKLKLMSFKDAPGKQADRAFIHSTLGINYLTLHVNDITASVNAAIAAGAKPLGKGAIELPPSIAKGVYLAVVRDPDGNMVEFVGGKK